MDTPLRMHAERTPNPDSIKWVLGRPVAGPGELDPWRAPRRELGRAPAER